MRAVNLIPADARGGSGSRGPSTGMQVPVYVLLGFLAVALALVTIYVLTNNSISSRTAKLNNLKTEVTQEQAAVARLGEFTKFAALAQTRISTVNSIAAARFDWHTALSDLSKVVPPNTTLQSIVGTVVPGANSGGSGSGGTGALRSAVTAPAFELSGCTRSQDDVAKLMSQLRLINGVTRVTISDSQMSNTTSSSTSTGAAVQGCGANTPNFDLVVFFQPVANAGPTGVTSVAGATPATTSGTTTAGTPATVGGTTTTPATTGGTTTTPATSGGTTTTPATTTTPGGTP
jgi:Tfp pilus assembly protein PilN